MTVDGDYFFSKNKQNNNICSKYLDDFLEICDRPDVEPDYMSEANYQNYFANGVVEDKEKNENFPNTNAADNVLKLQLKLHTVAKLMDLKIREWSNL